MIPNQVRKLIYPKMEGFLFDLGRAEARLNDQLLLAINEWSEYSALELPGVMADMHFLVVNGKSSFPESVESMCVELSSDAYRRVRRISYDWLGSKQQERMLGEINKYKITNGIENKEMVLLEGLYASPIATHLNEWCLPLARILEIADPSLRDFYNAGQQVGHLDVEVDTGMGLHSNWEWFTSRVANSLRKIIPSEINDAEQVPVGGTDVIVEIDRLISLIHSHVMTKEQSIEYHQKKMIIDKTNRTVSIMGVEVEKLEPRFFDYLLQLAEEGERGNETITYQQLNNNLDTTHDIGQWRSEISRLKTPLHKAIENSGMDEELLADAIKFIKGIGSSKRLKRRKDTDKTLTNDVIAISTLLPHIVEIGS